jgi:phosphoglycerol transferase MdoB-like AlkP superfamily enzyme
MNIKPTTVRRIDTKVLLSTLWIVVMINMLKADILSLFIPGTAEELARTSASTGASIPLLMLIGAVLGQIGIALIVLSRVLKYGINRWVNVVAAIVTIAYIWGGMAPYPHYIFIATMETLCLLLVILFAWTWRNTEA